MAKGTKYSREFKIEAVQLLKTGKTIAQVSKDLGIADVTLSSWKKLLAAEPEHAFPGKGNMLPHDAELRRLQREVAKLRMEKDILKKAIAMFSDPSR